MLSNNQQNYQQSKKIKSNLYNHIYIRRSINIFIDLLLISNELRQLKDSNSKIQTELALCKTNNIYETDNNIKSLMKQNEDLKREIRNLKDQNEQNNYYLLMDTQEKESQSINTINQLQSLLQDKDDELQRNDEVDIFFYKIFYMKYNNPLIFFY